MISAELLPPCPCPREADREQNRAVCTPIRPKGLQQTFTGMRPLLLNRRERCEMRRNLLRNPDPASASASLSSRSRRSRSSRRRRRSPGLVLSWAFSRPLALAVARWLARSSAPLCRSRPLGPIDAFIRSMGDSKPRRTSCTSRTLCISTPSPPPSPSPPLSLSRSSPISCHFFPSSFHQSRSFILRRRHSLSSVLVYFVSVHTPEPSSI